MTGRLVVLVLRVAWPFFAVGVLVVLGVRVAWGVARA